MATSTETSDAALNDLTLTVKVIASNYVTKEEAAVANGKLDLVANNAQSFHAHALHTFTTKEETAATSSKLDLLSSNLQAFQTYAMQTFASKAELAAVSGKLDLVANSLQTFQTHALQTFATKAEVANVVHQMTWRMAGFTVVLITAIIGSARYL